MIEFQTPFPAPATQAISAALGGGNSLVWAAPGKTLTLAGTNTFSGTLRVIDGTVAGTTKANFGAGPIAIAASGTVAINNSATQTFSTGISGSGTFSKSGAGVTIIAGTNSFSGKYAFTGGDCVFQGSVNAAQGKPRLELTTGKLLIAQAYVGQDLTFSEIASTGTSTVNTAYEAATGVRTLHAEQATNTTFNAVMSDASGSRLLALKKSGAGTLTLTGANTHTGGVTVNGGTLVSGSATALGTGAVTVNSGGTLTFSVNATGTRTVTVNAGGVVNRGGFAHTGTSFVNNGGTINA